MQICADKDITAATAAFSPYGDLHLFDRRLVDHAMWREVNAYSVASTGLAPDTVDLLVALGFAMTEC